MNEDSKRNMYAIKGVKEAIFNCKRGSLTLEVVNTMDCIKINGKTIVVLDFQVADDEIIEYLDGFNGGELEVSLDVKMYWDGNLTSKIKNFKGLNTIRKFANYSYEEPTTWKYIFADCDYSEIQKELIAYLLPNCKNDLTETLKQEQTLLLKKIKECREKGEFNTYKNLINALREVTYLVNQVLLAHCLGKK